MSGADKLDRKLRTLLDKVGRVDPTFEVDVVVTSAEEQATEPVAKRILDAGGRIRDRRAHHLQCTVLLVKLLDLADHDEISEIRLTRRHRMYTEP